MYQRKCKKRVWFFRIPEYSPVFRYSAAVLFTPGRLDPLSLDVAVIPPRQVLRPVKGIPGLAAFCFCARQGQWAARPHLRYLDASFSLRNLSNLWEDLRAGSSLGQSLDQPPHKRLRFLPAQREAPPLGPDCLLASRGNLLHGGSGSLRLLRWPAGRFLHTFESERQAYTYRGLCSRRGRREGGGL